MWCGAPAHREAPPSGAAASGPAPLAEQIAEQIAESVNVLVARGRAIARALNAGGIFAVVALLRPLLAAGVDLAAVVAPALLLVADYVGSVGYLLELLFGRLVALIEIGVQLLGELAVSLGDVGAAGRLLHAQDGIGMLSHLM